MFTLGLKFNVALFASEIEPVSVNGPGKAEEMVYPVVLKFAFEKI